MKLKKLFTLLICCVAFLAIFALPAFSASNMDYANDAPGGNVSNADELVAAFGKENATKVSETEVKLINSVILKKTINITNGNYTITALGCTVYRGFENGPLIMLDGSDIKQRPRLSLGRNESAMVTDGVEPDLVLDGCSELYPEADGSLIVVKGGAELNVYGKTQLTNAKNTGMGGAIFVELGLQTEADYSTPLEPKVFLKNCRIDKCSAELGGGAVAFVGYYNLYNVGTLTIDNVIFDKNTSENQLGSGNGGAIYMYGGEITVNTAKFTESKADNGAAMYICAKATLNDITAENNTANLSGGVLHVGESQHFESNVVLNDMFATKNVSNGNGGVVTNEGTLVGAEVYFTENDCTLNGGGVYNTGSFAMQEGSIMHNDAGISGGGIYCSGKNSVFMLIGGEVNSNDSAFAGAIYSEGSVDITGGAVGRNDSAEPHLVLKGKIRFGKDASIMGSNTVGLCITKDENGNDVIPIIELTGASTVLDYMYVGFFKEKIDKDGTVTGYKTANKGGRAVFKGDESDIKNTVKWYVVYSKGPVSYVLKDTGALSTRFIFLPVWTWFIIVPALGAGGYFGYKKTTELIKKKKEKSE